MQAKDTHETIPKNGGAYRGKKTRRFIVAVISRRKEIKSPLNGGSLCDRNRKERAKTAKPVGRVGWFSERGVGDKRKGELNVEATRGSATVR
jgi:hypothetical protein